MEKRSAPATPLISVIVAARNEETNLPTLLASLTKLSYSSYEVIVVDDQSTDGTASIAASWGARVVKIETPPPSGWVGKPYACLQGAEVAKGELLLFIDADIVLTPDSLSRMVEFMEAEQSPFISALPYHQCHFWWEKSLGAFHLNLIAALKPASHYLAELKSGSSPSALFAIGQFLCFTREVYFQMGGHTLAKYTLCEDLFLAAEALKRGINYRVYTALPPLFEVRMYQNFYAFVQGWRRLFRAGIRFFGAKLTLEVTLFIIAGLSVLTPPLYWVKSLAALIFMMTVMRYQRRLGNFSLWGALAYPLALLLFVAIATVVLCDDVLRRKVPWRGRSYSLPSS